VTGGGGGGGRGEPDASREAIADALTRLNTALARSIGPERTAQVREYIEHHEFGLALELAISLAIRHGLDADPYRADIAALSRAMEMEDSPYLSEWRKHGREA
jgi:hypothetical protein